MIQIRPADISDIIPYWEHRLRHVAESGRDGDVVFAPFENIEDLGDEGPEELLQKKTVRWSLEIDEIGWERAWILTEGRSIHGEIKLVQQIPVRAALHRATLMMGIERPYRGQGWGRKLIETAVQWARETGQLEWIDLNVFAHNESALKLYANMGFRENGRVRDLFRIGSQQIEDISMALKI